MPVTSKIEYKMKSTLLLLGTAAAMISYQLLAQEQVVTTVAPVTPAAPAATSGEKAKDAATKTNKVTFSSVKLVNDSGIDMGSQTFINTGSGIVSLQAPEGSRVKAEGQGRELLIYAKDSTSDFVSVKFEEGAGSLDFEAVRPLVLRKLSKAKIIGEYESAALGTNALGFDLEYTVSGEKWEGKALVAPVATGRLLVTATAHEKDARTIFFLMQRVISSLAVGSSEKELKQTFVGFASP